MKNLNEDGVSMIGGTPANNVGDGVIAGLGVNNPKLANQAEPGVDKKNKKKVLPFKDFVRRQMRIK